MLFLRNPFIALHLSCQPFMFTICKKELGQFFSSLTGYLAIAVFLLLMGLFLFVFPDTSLLDYGFATMDKFFDLAPWLLLLLVPAVTMRSFTDEFKSGTWELLKTKPLTLSQIIGGKYLSAFIVSLLALLPTLIYVFSIQQLMVKGNVDNQVDVGGIAGSYIGLLLTTAVFTAIGICCSTFTNNAVVSFLISAVVCFVMYNGFSALSHIPSLKGNGDYYIGQIGLEAHYRSAGRGLIELKDMVYFVLIAGLFLFATRRVLSNSK